MPILKFLKIHMSFSKPKRDSWALEINVFQTFRHKSRRQSTSWFNILNASASFHASVENFSSNVDIIMLY